MGNERMACTAPRAVTTLDRLSVRLDDCDLFEISVGLHEDFETAGMRIETWPAPARIAVEREAEKWIERNPDRIVRLVSHGATKGAVYYALHHAPKPKTK